MHLKVERNDFLTLSASIPKTNIFAKGPPFSALSPQTAFLQVFKICIGQKSRTTKYFHKGLDPSTALLHVVFGSPDVEHIVAAHQNLHSR